LEQLEEEVAFSMFLGRLEYWLWKEL